MQENTTEKKTSEKTEYYIVSEEVMDFMRHVVYNNLTMAQAEPIKNELFNAPTFTQFVELQEQKKPKIVVN